MSGASTYVRGIHLDSYAIPNHTCRAGVHNNVMLGVFRKRKRQTNDVGLTTVTGNQSMKA